MLAWLKECADLMVLPSNVSRQYFALEGLPCAGKTTTIQALLSSRPWMFLSELRLPLDEESYEHYLAAERQRADAIRVALAGSPSAVLLGDRSIISTIAHRAAVAAYAGPPLSNNDFSLLSQAYRDTGARTPRVVVEMGVGVELSRRRQGIRDRDALDGRHWYDRTFLQLFQTSLEQLLEECSRSNTVTVARVSTVTLGVDAVVSTVSDLITSHRQQLGESRL